MIRKANVSDTESILKTINRFAEKDLMLPRSLQEIYENIRDYTVYLEGERLVGCAALHVFWKDLAEIKSLAVDESCQGKGIAKELVRECVKEAATLRASKAFVLTYLPDFFLPLGFRIVEKESLPQKIWTECIKCHKFPECTEIAMILDLPASL